MKKRNLVACSAWGVLAMFGAGFAVSAPAYAQAAAADQPPPPAATTAPAQPESPGTVEEKKEATAKGKPEQAIIITGTILRTNKETPSPVTVITSQNIAQRGISTTQDAIQMLASNNGPALTNSFTANGAFAAGASAVSLRGLSTNSTLVLFDGMRAAYYPLADDGSRNFVDLNTIPDDIVDRIEVLKDGASSIYGADAIAGVVNIITKKQVTGLHLRAEAGRSSRGDAPEYRGSITAGIGDLEDNGFNAYLSGFYYRSKQLKNSDRPYPYNSDDLRDVCHDGTCGGNGVVNGVQSDGSFALGTAANLLVRPYDPTNTTAQGPYQDLNPSLGCIGGGVPYTLTPDQQAANPISPSTVCQYDYTKLYGVIQPDIKRFGVSGRVTADIDGGRHEAYGEVNFMQSTVAYTGFPATIRGTANTGIFYPQFSTSGTGGTLAPGSFALTLPVYVCPEGVGDAKGVNTGCDASNGTLNPNNPFAAQGQVARLIGRITDQVTHNETRTRAYRGAIGIKGSITDNIDYHVDATAMHVDLRRTSAGYVYIQHLLDAIAKGTYNFVNPDANTQAQNDFLMPTDIADASSDLDQIEGVVSARLADLSGGPLQLGAGGSVYYEAVDAPSGNSDVNGPTQRWFTLNAFGTQGSRWVKSAFAELDAPVLKQVDINASGRYDSYTSGQHAFSPKLGIKVVPIRQLALRGTWSRGFRIPSFGEANALPTTGYVSNNVSLFNDAYLAQYGCTTATFSSCPAYIRAGSYGQTSLATPDLQPERSRNITLGAIFEPVRNVSFTADFYAIRKTGAITAPSNAPALLAYYNGQPIPAGYVVVPDAPDPNFPNATPRVAFVQAHLVNANTIIARGLDFGASIKHDFGPVRWNSFLDAEYILRLETKFPDGHVERYDGTLGNFNLTAGSGTPKLHGSWLNSFDFGNLELNVTTNLFGGYDLSAMDQGTGYKDCGLDDGSVPCQVPNYWTFDLNAQYKFLDKFTLSATVLNVFDRLPPLDPVTYGAHLYNPVQGGLGILGRFFKVGLSVDLEAHEAAPPPFVAPPAPPPPPPAAPATQTCADGSVILATAACPPPPPPPPPPPAPVERGERGE